MANSATFDLYRGYKMNAAERRSAAETYAAERGIKYKSALRAIQRATTETGTQRIKNTPQLKTAITKAVEETRSQPDETSPEEVEGYVFYWETEMPTEYSGPITIIDTTIGDRDGALLLAEEWAFGTFRANFEASSDPSPLVIRVTLQYVPPRVIERVVKKKTKKAPRQTQPDAIDEGYNLKVDAAFLSDLTKRK